MKNILQTLCGGVLSTVFPEKCAFCNSLSEKTALSHGICASCEKRIVYLDDPDISGALSDVAGAPDKIYCACRYTDKIKKAIVSLKYGGKGYLAKTLAWVIFAGVSKSLDFTGYDFICAVPSSEKKVRDRGYNHAELLAHGLAGYCGTPLRKDVLYKSKDLTSQSLLNMEQRLKSVSGIYRVSGSEDVSGKNIIVVDDVLTTGATITECARILKESGAHIVTAIILATGKRNI